MEVREKLNFKVLFKSFWQPEEQEIPEIDAILNSDELSEKDKAEMKKTLNELKKLETKYDGGISATKSKGRAKTNIPKVDGRVSVREVKEKNLEKDEDMERE